MVVPLKYNRAQHCRPPLAKVPPMKSCARLFLLCVALYFVDSQVAGSLYGFESESTAKPNIVYFLVDDLGYADCGFNGGKDIQTPNIDRLAKEGTILKSFYVQTVCSPTRAALMTGRYATQTSVYNVVRPGAPWGLPLSERILPQTLKECGYATAICGKWHLGEFEPAYQPTRRGFDRQYGHMFGALDYFTHIRDGKLDWYRNDVPLEEKGYSTHLIAKEACRIIQEKAADKPLFLYVPFNGIHGPHQVPDSYKEPYKALPNLRQTIAGMLSAVDESIGQITTALTDAGLRNNTLIIFSSDNGGPAPGKATMNTPLRAGKGTIYEGGVRVSSFVNWPGKIKAGITIDEPIHAVDWYPTLVKLAGSRVEPANPLDGLDIWPVLTQSAKSPHDAILLVGNRPGVSAVRMGNWKLLVSPTDKDAEEQSGDQKTSGKLELYNLVEDIAESKNLADAQPDRVKAMRTRLESFLKNAVAPGDSVQIKKPISKKQR